MRMDTSSYGTFKPFAHDLDVHFDATPATFHLSPAKITSGATQIVLTRHSYKLQQSPDCRRTTI